MADAARAILVRLALRGFSPVGIRAAAATIDQGSSVDTPILFPIARALLTEAIHRKPRAHRLAEHFSPRDRTMAQIGG